MLFDWYILLSQWVIPKHKKNANSNKKSVIAWERVREKESEKKTTAKIFVQHANFSTQTCFVGQFFSFLFFFVAYNEFTSSYVNHIEFHLFYFAYTLFTNSLCAFYFFSIYLCLCRRFSSLPNLVRANEKTSLRSYYMHVYRYTQYMYIFFNTAH